jgi:hypothetical protein
VRGIVWCDVCWAQRIEAERRQEIRGKKAEQAMLLILAASVVLGFGSTFVLELSMVGKFGPLTVFGGVVVSGVWFVALILVWGIREWFHMPPTDR